MSFIVLCVPLLPSISLMVRYDREGSQLARLFGVLRQGGGMPESLSWSAVNLIDPEHLAREWVCFSVANPPSSKLGSVSRRIRTCPTVIWSCSLWVSRRLNSLG